jgi:CBS domain-containing protein
MNRRETLVVRIEERPEFKSKAKPLTAVETDTVFNAVNEMNDKNFGSIAVIGSDGRVVGIFTERDLLRRVVARGKDPQETTLADVMTKEIRVAAASDEVIDWLRQMSNERFRHVPVVDDKGEIVHMMSQGDFVSYTWPDLLSRVKEEVGYAYPKLSPAIWLVAGVAVYTIVIILILLNTI